MKKVLGNISPRFIRQTYRWMRYGHERSRAAREPGIKKRQNDLLPELFLNDERPLVLFLVQGADRFTGKDSISGGAISIMSLCEETRKLNEEFGFQTIMCTMNEEFLLEKHEQFENNTPVFRFEQIPRYFTHTPRVIIHVPEYLTGKFISTLTDTQRDWLSSRDLVHVNIMNQNIRLMPGAEIISLVSQVAQKITITTAHQKYCTPAHRKEYGVPIHKFSVWISPEQYRFVPWKDKENLLVVSPDRHPLKEAILQQLQSVPGLKVQVIQNLTYTEYKELIARAKWSLTFGEGLDGYLIEPVFSGAIGFAVYNEEFFTEEFRTLPTIYSSYEALVSQLIPDMGRMDQKDIFPVIQKELFGVCALNYSGEVYVENIKKFYLGEFTYA